MVESGGDGLGFGKTGVGVGAGEGATLGGLGVRTNLMMGFVTGVEMAEGGAG